MKIPAIENLDIPDLISTALNFPSIGKLAAADNGLVYLDIDDEYIHQLFPLIENSEVKEPDYFQEGSVGAHISVVYPEEGKTVDKKDLGGDHRFKIKDVIAANIDAKTYYAILIESPSLLQIRRKYSLPDMLCFKGYSLGFHITIAIKS